MSCGCTTYGVSPAYTLESKVTPEEKKFAINVRLLDDYALFRGVAITEIDGRNSAYPDRESEGLPQCI